MLIEAPARVAGQLTLDVVVQELGEIAARHWRFSCTYNSDATEAGTVSSSAAGGRGRACHLDGVVEEGSLDVAEPMRHAVRDDHDVALGERACRPAFEAGARISSGAVVFPSTVRPPVTSVAVPSST